MRAFALVLIAACGARAAPPASPANRGGGDTPPLDHALRLDVDAMPHDYAIDPVVPIDVLVESRVVAADVILDGQLVGRTPMAVHVSAGHHVIRVYAEGY